MTPAMHENMMRLALEQAHFAYQLGEVPIGAVIARGEEVVARAHNRTQTDHDPTAHAEILALRAAGEALSDFRLGGHTLYVTLEPCAMCAGAIGTARLAGVWYGARDVRAGCCGSIYLLPQDPALGFSVPVYPGLLAQPCLDILQRFFAERRRAPSL